MAEDWQFEIDGLTLAGLAFGPADGLPLLALHGWMDHAASFSELAPLLPGCRIIAPDLSGHGLSSHRSPDASYNIWDDLPQLSALPAHFGWKSYVLAGHSRGAAIATLLAAAEPGPILALIAIDSLTPLLAEAEDFPAMLGAYLRQTRRRKEGAPRLFASREEYIARRCQQGNARVTAERLADRALKPVAGGFQLRADLRLFASSAARLTRPQAQAALRAISAPVLTIRAQNGLAEGLAPDFAACLARHEDRLLPGDHHLHLDPETAPAVAREITAFLRRAALL